MDNKQLIHDFFTQIEELMNPLSEIVSTLESDINQLSKFAEYGQLIDRIYGVAKMLQYEDLSLYLQNMKELSYKCEKTDNETVHLKALNLMRASLENMKKFVLDGRGGIAHDSQEIKLRIERKKAEKIISRFLRNIEGGSVEYENVDEYILFYDPSAKIKLKANESKETSIPTPFFASAAGGIKKELANKEKNILGVVLDIDNDTTIWPRLLEECNKLRPDLPVILSAKKNNDLKKFNKKSLGIAGCLSTGNNFKLFYDDVKKIVGPNKSAQVIKPKENIPPENYSPVFLNTFKSGGVFPFNVYIKLNDDKFVKIISKYEIFDENILDNHENKGVQTYYINKDDYSEYINVLQGSIDNACSLEGNDTETIKINFLNCGKDISSLIAEKGVNEESVLIAKKFVENSSIVVNKMAESNPVIQNFLQDLVALDHGVSVCMMAGLFLNKIGIAKNLYDDITLGCLLHDVGLIEAPDLVKVEDESLMNEEEKKIFYNHPQKGADILKGMNIKEAIIDAVALHHSSPSQTEFTKSEKGQITNNPISELIRMSETLVSLTQKYMNKEINIDPIEYFKMHYLFDYSLPTRKAFNYVFDKK